MIDKELRLSFKRFGTAMQDNDKDGYPNVMDCQPNNPNKQGWKEVKEKVSGKLTEWGDKYKEYKAKAPERMQAKVDVAEQREKLQLIRERTALSRAKVQKARIGLMQQNQRAMGAMPSMFGNQPSMMSPFATAKPKKKSKKSKGKYVIRGGKAYPIA